MKGWGMLMLGIRSNDVYKKESCDRCLRDLGIFFVKLLLEIFLKMYIINLRLYL